MVTDIKYILKQNADILTFTALYLTFQGRFIVI